MNPQTKKEVKKMAQIEQELTQEEKELIKMTKFKNERKELIDSIRVEIDCIEELESFNKFFKRYKFNKETRGM